jgi:MFS superfamily sulfate permease-like transporter
MKRLLTFFSWPEVYKIDNLKADVLAGLTVALVLIPQSLAYAELADLPSYYGLYASFLPPLEAALLGSSRQLATGLEECRYIDVVRCDGPLFFANASYLEDQIRNRRPNKKELKHIVISASDVNDIDASGEEALSLTVDRVRSARIDISLSGVNRSVMSVLKRTHLIVKIGEDHI